MHVRDAQGRVVAFWKETGILILSCLWVACGSLLGAEFAPTGSTRILDLSGTGRYILQRDGFSLPGGKTSNLSVLDILTGAVDPVNYDETGAFFSSASGLVANTLPAATATAAPLLLWDRADALPLAAAGRVPQ